MQATTGTTIGEDTPTAELTLNLRPEHYPFWSQSRLEALQRVEFFADTTQNTVEISTNIDGTGNKDLLIQNQSLGNLRTGKLTEIPLPPAVGEFTLYFNDNSMEALWLAVTWGQG